MACFSGRMSLRLDTIFGYALTIAVVVVRHYLLRFSGHMYKAVFALRFCLFKELPSLDVILVANPF